MTQANRGRDGESEMGHPRFTCFAGERCTRDPGGEHHCTHRPLNDYPDPVFGLRKADDQSEGEDGDDER